MKQTIIIIAFGILPTFSFAQNNQLTEKAAQQKAIKTANEDYQKGHPKYYFHGIAAPSKSNLEALKKYKITVINKGCITSTYEESYNEEVNRLLIKDKKPDISVILSKKS